MGSIFINAGLAAGVALAAVPVILHLFMKQTPKRVVFPALRLIRERQKRSKKKLRVKNWLLLLARMALVALMALALARPCLRHQHVDGLQAKGQDAADGGQGTLLRDPQEAARLEPGLRDRFGVAER